MNMSIWRARAGEGGGPSHGALSVYIYICLHIWACAEKKSERGVGSLLGVGAAPISFCIRPPPAAYVLP